MEQEYKYFAFISYSSQDTKWGWRIQKKLEGYRMPTTLCSQHGWSKRPMKPIFFAPTDIQPGDLTQELKERLQYSKNLIVVCSPHSAQSEWVGKEIKHFHHLGRTANIYLFIIDGKPNSKDADTECFNPVIKELGIPEKLGANIHENAYHWPWLNKERAYVQLITKLLGVEFDSLWQRHRRILFQKVITWFIGTIAIIITMMCLWIHNKPIDVSIDIKDGIDNKYLPPMKNAIVTMFIGEEIKTDTVKTIGDTISFHHIPHRYLREEIRVIVECNDYKKLDTIIVLNRTLSILLYRDADVYGKVRFGIWNSQTEKMIPNVNVKIDGIETRSDANGIVTINIPLEQQKMEYTISADIPLKDNIKTMPCGKNDVITTL